MNTQPNPPTPNYRRRLFAFASTMRGLGILIGIVGVVGGVALATHTVGDSYYDEEVYPFVGAGIGMAVSSVITALVFAFVAAFAEAWLLTTEPLPMKPEAS